MPEVKFGPYTLIRRIAVGGMAEVFLARPERPAWDDFVVVKQILPQLAEEPELLQLFFDEARIASRIFHPGIIRILDVGEHDGVHFLAMEYVDGLDLSQLMKLTKEETNGKQMPLGSALRVAVDLARAVHFAHEAREPDGTPLEIVHRDVSPQNVLISKKGEVKLGDFGIARATIRAKRTQTGILRGKIAYVSPEQYLGQRGDRRVDIYAIGIVLYEMIAGRRPFMGEEAMVIQEVMTKNAPPISAFVPSADKRLTEIIATSLARSPEDRFSTAYEFADALEDLRLADDQDALSRLAKKALAYREKKTSEDKERSAQKARATMTLPHPSDVAAADPLPAAAGPRPTETLLGPLNAISGSHAAVTVRGPSAPNLKSSSIPTQLYEEADHGARPAPQAQESLPATEAMPVAVVQDEFLAEPATVMETNPASMPELPRRNWSSRSIIATMVVIGLASGWMVSSLKTEESDAALQGKRIIIPTHTRARTASVTVVPPVAIDDPAIEPEGDATDDEEVDIEPPKSIKASDEPHAVRRVVRRKRVKHAVVHPPLAHAPPPIVHAPPLEKASPVAAVVEEEPPKGEGELSLDTTPWSYVFVGKKELGVTPLAHVKVPAGKQKVRLENPERGLSRTILLNIEANKATALRVDLADGTVLRR